MGAFKQLYYKKTKEREKKTFTVSRALYARAGEAISIQCEAVLL